MKHLRIWLALLAGMAMATAQGQSLPLEQLHKLSTLPQGLPLAKMTTVLLPVGWTYQGHLDMSPEVYWTTELMATDSLDGETPESWLSLRPMPGNLTDVLFKTQLARNFEPLRRELKRMKIEPTPVYCLEGKGERYETAFYSLTLYSGKKGQYRYIAVLHPIPVPPPWRPLPRQRWRSQRPCCLAPRSFPLHLPEHCSPSPADVPLSFRSPTRSTMACQCQAGLPC